LVIEFYYQYFRISHTIFIFCFAFAAGKKHIIALFFGPPGFPGGMIQGQPPAFADLGAADDGTFLELDPPSPSPLI